jgi:hypothetical protein
MAANTHNVLIDYTVINDVWAKCQCGWSIHNRVSASDAKSQWLAHVKKRDGKPGKIRFRH